MMYRVRILMALVLLTFVSGASLAQAQETCAEGFAPRYAHPWRVSHVQSASLQHGAEHPLRAVAPRLFSRTRSSVGAHSYPSLYH